MVCSGNTCRSPLARALLARRLPGAQIGSAGLTALSGQAAQPNAVRVAGEAGLDLTGHVARRLDEALPEGADLVLTMTRALRDQTVGAYPEIASRTLTLGEAAGEPEVDVPDPYGTDLDGYREIFRRLEELCERAAHLLREPAPLGRVFAFATTEVAGPVSRRLRAWLLDGGFRVEEPKSESQTHGARGSSAGTSGGGMEAGFLSARWVADALRRKAVAGGVVVTGSGIEAAYVTARLGLRSVLGGDSVTVRVARGSFAAQVLCLGGRMLGEDSALDLLRAFARTPFAGTPEELEALEHAALSGDTPWSER